MTDERIAELEKIIAETYQVVGVLAIQAGRFDDEAVVKALDNLAEARLVHDDVIPFEGEPTEVERAFNDGWNRALDQIIIALREVEDPYSGDRRKVADSVMSKVRDIIVTRRLHM